MALIRATHPVYGTCLIPHTKVALHPEDWTVLDEHVDEDLVDHDEHTTGSYDPAAHRVDDVLAWLRRADAAERGRVVALERTRRRPRKTVLAFEDRQPPAADGAGDTHSPAGDDPGQNQED